MTDLMVLRALLLIASDCTAGADVKAARLERCNYSGALAKLLKADRVLFNGRFSELILETFKRRKIFAAQESLSDRAADTQPGALPEGLRRLPADEIPASEDILSASDLARQLKRRGVAEYSLIGAGDIMLGDRTRQPIKDFGEDYPFLGALPLLKHSAIVCGNLEGPFAREADRQDRTYSYRVDPRLAHTLKRANIDVVTLANNHLVDCGRAGVLETFDALDRAGVHMIGAGRNELAAHEPVILDAGPLRVGILGYYWNRRCAATRDLPGSATDEAKWLTADIESLRRRVDRIVTMFHWGVPYVKTPQPDDRAKARLAVELGADLVIGHHPHVIQPFEIYKGRLIFYSVGNFTFGSGNSKAEGLLVAARFETEQTVCDVYPIYVKNRDPRVNYQPKALGGAAGRKILRHLAAISGPSGAYLDTSSGVGELRVQRPAFEETAT
jgi:poly-gamma-glutamate capsule biosynthesis protein CapA/YwtB (metallophosphatase superfamily)